MVLKRLLGFFVFVAASCTSGTTRVPLPADAIAGARGTTADVDDILAERNYTFAFAYEGCFGGGKESLAIRDKKIAIYTFPVFGEADRVKEKVDTVAWTSEKEVLLREICMLGIQSSDTSGGCTTTTRFELTGSLKSVAFTDHDCALSDAVERLIK